jgi:DHA2 family multidrug resistance protein
MKTASSSEHRFRLRERLRDATREAILDAAASVFTSDGAASARMEDIAAAAGIAVGTLYNYFEDRAALVTALLEIRTRALLDALDAAVAESEAAHRGAGFEDELDRFVGALATHFDANRALLTVLFDEERDRGLDVHAASRRRTTVQEVFVRAERLMARGIRRRALQKGDAALYAALLVGMVRGVATSALARRDARLAAGNRPRVPERSGVMRAPAAVIAARPVPRAVPTNKWLVTISISFGTLMGAIDSSIVNVALPHIRGAVGATLQEITWISTGYAVALVLVMPLTAFLGRLFGQKRIYMFFLVGSFLCGTSTTLASLVVYRVIQGLGAGALQPTEQAILRQTFPPKEQGMAMALFGMAVMLGPAIGPTLGGYIVDHYHWSWIFFINLPVGLLGLFMVASFVHEDPELLEQNRALAEEQRRNVDWWGIAFMWVGLAALEYFLEEGSRDDWFASRVIIAVFLVAVFSLAAFVIRELTAKIPAVDLRLFKDPVFLSGTMIGALMFAMLMANMFLLPIYMQEMLGFSAVQSGMALMPRVLIMMVTVPIVGRIYNAVSPRLTIAVGVVLFSVSSWQLSHLTLESGTRNIVLPLLIQGAGFACLFVPLTTVALSSIPRHRLADATGLNSLLRQIGGAVGLAIFATLIGNYAVVARGGIDPHLTATRPEVWQRLQMLQQGFIARGMDAVSARSAALRALAGSAVQQSMVLSFDRIFVLAGGLFLLVMPLLYFLRMSSTPGGAAGDAHIEM